jgi:predicted amidohydrolase
MTLRIAAFQFATKPTIGENFRSLERGIIRASENGVHLLLTQECGLTGYPPVEIPAISFVDRSALEEALDRLQVLATERALNVVVGAACWVDSRWRNSLVVLGPGKGRAFRYDKRALWGWDRDNFAAGTGAGIFDIQGVKVGLGICFEIRFPEYFREMFDAAVEVALVSFCDIAPKADPDRRGTIRSHLVTRAVENAFPVVSANTVAIGQTAPTMVVSPDGVVLCEASDSEEDLVYFDYQRDEPNFGRRGRLEVSRALRSTMR